MGVAAAAKLFPKEPEKAAFYGRVFGAKLDPELVWALDDQAAMGLVHPALILDYFMKNNYRDVREVLAHKELLEKNIVDSAKLNRSYTTLFGRNKVSWLIRSKPPIDFQKYAHYSFSAIQALRDKELLGHLRRVGLQEDRAVKSGVKATLDGWQNAGSDLQAFACQYPPQWRWGVEREQVAGPRKPVPALSKGSQRKGQSRARQRR